MPLPSRRRSSASIAGRSTRPEGDRRLLARTWTSRWSSPVDALPARSSTRRVRWTPISWSSVIGGGPVGVEAARLGLGRGRRSRAVSGPRRARRPARAGRARRRRLAPCAGRRGLVGLAALRRPSGHRGDRRRRWVHVYRAVAPALYADSIDRLHGRDRDRTSCPGCPIARRRSRGWRSDGVRPMADVRTGDPAHEIVACARERAPSVIVIGSRGQTGIRRLVLGSVARGVLLQAPCSVLIVHDGAQLRSRCGSTIGSANARWSAPSADRESGSARQDLHASGPSPSASAMLAAS